MHLLAIALAGHDPELVADRCWQAGAAGLWEVDESTLRAGVEDDHVEAFLAQLTDLAPVDVTNTEAVELAGRVSTLLVAGRAVELWVPPTVFGDGNHPTTATCLSLLPELVAVGDRVLDVGCGAGALTVAAAILGGRVTAIDIDPEAVIATAHNAARNGVAVGTSSAGIADMAGGGGRFEVVVANLTTGSLAPMVPDLARCTEAGGTLLISGMLEDQWPPLRQGLGGRVAAERIVEGWVTAAVESPRPTYEADL